MALLLSLLLDSYRRGMFRDAHQVHSEKQITIVSKYLTDISHNIIYLEFTVIAQFPNSLLRQIRIIDFTSYKRVSVLYSKFHAINLQEQVIEDILTVDDPNDFYGSKDKVEIERGENLYDPDFASINTKLWFNSFMGRFYLSLCESVTCEHCCRMISMESANTNTKSMLNKLVLDYNRSRQAAITTDLIEVVSGCEALG
ncbi:ATP synthase family protein [Anaplasma phagocytophilum]|nr:F0F1 ATP synthase subunit gamma [Anaplasma phagocytophilum]AGR79489.1 hypothetical protein YYU_03780 [Anaplasma phagocytophilum str. HZ2]AGR80738.1 hypothetical protein WSQ_03780 [Anaplasma phagocytophilum str. JM]AGR81990.1 hypothetical protein YYY_03770 [Anaplasma phagocytophilum str. Dog2]EOA61094.1 ATP synthase F1 [Anaplasma phagocytophilum str. HGE1]KJZ99766.1 ATP synthase family protein [Anaplasma phagocytophilum]